MFSAKEKKKYYECFSILYWNHARTLRAVAFTLLGNYMDAEDVVQDVFLRLMKKPEVIAGMQEEVQKAFLIICTRNQAKNLLRQKKAWQEVGWEASELELYDTHMEKEAMILNLKEEMAKLPELHRDILLLHYHMGLPFREIGVLLGKSTGAVQKIAYRARDLLQERLGGEI